MIAFLPPNNGSSVYSAQFFYTSKAKSPDAQRPPGKQEERKLARTESQETIRVAF